MRTTKDRIRHAVCFEVIGLILTTTLMTLLGFDTGTAGIVGVLFSVIATVWNFLFTKWFDYIMVSHYKTTVKTTYHRVLQSVGFELGLLALAVPVIAHAYSVSYFDALMLDIGLVVFFLFYSYAYNYVYDKLFPVKAILAS